MDSVKKWYVVYTRAKWEKKVAGLLARKQLESYCPLNKVSRQWSDRKKEVCEPLFNSYVFVNVSESQHVAIRQTDGVLSLVHWLGKPAVVRQAEIDAIMEFVGTHSGITVENIPVNVNDRVLITNGPLINREGEVLEVTSKYVKLRLPSLGYVMTAEVSKMHVKKYDQREPGLVRK